MSDYQLSPDLLTVYHHRVDEDHAGTLTDAGRKQLEETRRLLEYEHMRQPAMMRVDALARERHAAVAEVLLAMIQRGLERLQERLQEHAGDE